MSLTLPPRKPPIGEQPARTRSASGRRPRAARLSPADILHVGSAGLRTRPLRVALSSFGIAIGIATMIAVVGISASTQAQLTHQLDALGTNLLVASPGQSLLSGDTVELPQDGAGRVSRIDGVEQVGATGSTDATARRSAKISAEETSGIAVQAAGPQLLSVLRARMGSGSWLNAATGRYPAVVLGHVSARRLGVVAPGEQIWIGNRSFTVIGILAPVPLAPEIERSALVGWSAAQTWLGFDGHPTSVYERSSDAAVGQVRTLIPRTLDPQAPQNVQVSDPSAALQAKVATEGAFNTLLLGLGAIALLVGGIGVANTMIISVLERRFEIGLRRALGATRGQIRIQFVTESLLLSGLGGVTGVALGAAATGIYAHSSGLPWVVPLWAIGGGLGATLLIGTIAGLYPAVRAARLSPTLALHAT
jgi:putative ABC transport system permease protein